MQANSNVSVSLHVEKCFIIHAKYMIFSVCQVSENNSLDEMKVSLFFKIYHIRENCKISLLFLKCRTVKIWIHKNAVTILFQQTLSFLLSCSFSSKGA